MRRRAAVVFAAMVGGLGPAAARAQTHAVKKPETVVRAVAVYEWTGDEAKPSASRIVPVSLFINNQLEDAGLYMARPVPFALDRGNIFEAQKAGVPEGTLELAFQQHLEGTPAAPFDDGWMGFAAFKPKPNQPILASKRPGRLPQVVASGGNRPHFSNGSSNSSASNTTASTADDPNKPVLQKRSGSTDSSASDTNTTGSGSGTTSSSNDPNKPVLQKRSDSADTSSSGTSGSSSGNSTAAATPTSASTSSSSDSDDPNRPVLQRRSNSSDTSSDSASSASGSSTSGSSTDPAGTTAGTTTNSGSSTASNGSDSNDDADRPTLKKRTPSQQAKTTQQRKGDQASVIAGGNLNDDPDRPTLHRGMETGPSIVPLMGLPADMHQMVAVSDAKDRSEHDFTRPWESDAEKAEVLEAMQSAARDQLAKYDMPAPAPAAEATPAPAPAAAKSAAAKSTAAKTATARGKKPAPPPPPPPPPPAPLADESLRGYTLSYGGAATFVYTATSPGTAGATRYVSIVAQREPQGELKVALASVTDSKHLDRTPWMRLVDVVDAEASNRASLLFELREDHARQFALYRVIGAEAEQTFETGTTE